MNTERNEIRPRPLAKAFAAYLICFVGGLVLIGSGATYFALQGDFRELLRTHLETSLQNHVHTFNLALIGRLELLRDYAMLPVLTDGVAAPAANKRQLAEFVNSLHLLDQDPCIVVYDYRGKPLLANGGECPAGDAGTAETLRPLLAGASQHAIRITRGRDRDERRLRWFLAVPVLHDGSPEGVFAASLTTDLGAMVGDTGGHHLQLLQNGGVVAEMGDGAESFATAELDLAFPGLSLKMGDDGSGMRTLSRSILQQLVISLLLSAGILAVLLYPVGRRIIVTPHVQLRELSDMLEEKNIALRREAAERIQTMDLLEYKSLLLEQQEQFLRDVIEDQTELICRFRTDGAVTFANSSYCDFVGLAKEEVENNARFLVVGEGDFGGLDDLMSGLTPETPTTETTLSLTDAKGDFRWMHWTLRALLFDDGVVKEYQAVGRDVTETRSLQLALERTNRELEKRVAERTSELMQKNTDLAMEINERRQAEEAARSNERLLSTLLDGLNAAFVVIERTSGRVVKANPAAEALLGVDAESLDSEKCSALLRPLFGETCGMVYADQEGGEGYTEERLVRADGTAVPVDCFLLPVDEEHRAVILFDISRRKELERQLNTAQKMESIGLLASGIAHEINTPIQYTGDSVRFLKEAFDDVIRLLAAHGELIGRARGDGAYGEILATIEDLTEEADLGFVIEEFPKACERALEGTARVAKIVLAMKNFAHPGTEEKKAVDLNKALENTITVAKNEWKYYAQMNLDLSPELPLVHCRPGDINQVFLNIIVNAAHAIRDVVGDSDNVGSIGISSALEHGRAVIRIKDSGSGIAPENMDKIFDPFFTTKEVGRGTGQGLAIVHDIVVDKHGGSIDVKSEVGTGTTFIITLPIQPDEEVEAA